LFDCETTNGQDGAPIRYKNDKGEWQTIGVNIRSFAVDGEYDVGEDYDGDEFSFGCLLTEKVYQNFINPNIEEWENEYGE